MLCRFNKLHEAINKFTYENAKHLTLSKNEWDQVNYIIDLLRPFAVFTELIGTTRDPTIHQVFDIYNYLMEHLEIREARLKKKKRAWRTILCEGVEAARRKLIEYYSNTDSSSGYLYGFAILLNPAVKESFWYTKHWKRDLEWQATYWVHLEQLYNKEYSSRSGIRKTIPTNLTRKPTINLGDVLSRLTDRKVQAQQADTEISDAQAEWLDYRQSGKYSGSISGSYLC